MIRYSVSYRDLLRRIQQEVPNNWLHRARQRTHQFRQYGGYFEDETDAKPFWSELKHLYLDLQKSKCIFCERSFDDVEYGTIEMDIEHYRPRRIVHSWPSDDMRKKHPHLSHYPRLRGAALLEGY